MKAWRQFNDGWYIGLLLMLLAACDLVSKPDKSDRLLAKVHNKSLYLSELDGMFPRGTTQDDSTVIINSFIERWTRETLLLQEAERNIPSDLNIDKLVRDYRASLIRNNYEKILVEELLDSTLTAEEILDYYSKHREEFKLNDNIVRCYFVKLPLGAPNQALMKSWWENLSNAESRLRLLDYCNEYANSHLLEDSTWYRITDIVSELPPGTLSVENVSRRELTTKDGDYQYFLRITEVKDKNQDPPISFVQDQIRRVILRDRKLKLLEDKKEELYELEMRRNNIKIYNQ
ncbi:MAG: hypothetical protein ACK4TA_09725 [Saprospiraceae bacterium]